MTTVSRIIAAPADQVFAVLSDGWSYSNWVTGTSHMRAVDALWPQPGSKLHHAAGIWPAVLRDETVAEQLTAGSRLELIARGRPLGEARVVIELVAEDSTTRVTMTETPVSGPGKWLHNPITDGLLARRNAESLARLAAIAERRTEPID